MMLYKVEFEVVGQQFLALYTDVDPTTHRGAKQIVPNTAIPDEHWAPVKRESEDFQSINDQYDRLSDHHKTNTGFVRNPRIYQAKHPEWVEMKPRDIGGLIGNAFKLPQ